MIHTGSWRNRYKHKLKLEFHGICLGILVLQGHQTDRREFRIGQGESKGGYSAKRSDFRSDLSLVKVSHAN